MSDDARTEVTQLLNGVSAGDAQAGDALAVMVYDELHRIAVSSMRREAQEHTLQPTVLVHEAFMRLVGSDVEWKSRQHFFATAARAMRRLLVDHARQRQRLKRGGASARRVALADDMAQTTPNEVDLLALNEALDKLEAYDGRKAQVVMLRYFAGLSIDQTAEVLDVARNTVKNDWNFAKAWLLQEMSGAEPTTDE